ncbi:mycofactocin system glycosyltransferase [Nocardioides psychrotolerans]|uniref:Mycofactocin system glycosyltransferase n=1 Tax=Nocardioides psychrotolerans TaxID=1005945 RepID=A0A1I3BSX9_9ACTN|nr:mycofactocin biosynthesis glycosyltransferase MftF [Nocardioides psychrotolerans]GEP36470.1 mycofactocin system glycosyltransferase [Nocardioides psychrotolerans]SFH65280.1 mycofactocin system glycosyltransferase [Nocardioides psychrotolerans]
MTLPADFGVALSSTVHVCDGGRSLVGGGRVLRLSSSAAEVVATFPSAVGGGQVAQQVARRLLDAGVADPWWADPPPRDDDVGDVTVVVPTRDRAGAVAGLIASLPPGLPVVVVDDGSTDPGSLAAVAAEHGARLVRHPRNLGPAAARNSGLRAVRTAYVVFCDSDVRPDPGWLGALRRHLDDPAVALVGPRVLGLQGLGQGAGSWVERYEQDRSSLDLGPTPAAVRVHGAVAYLPSACLLARVADLGTGFDEAMRSGEDVDLVWRLLGEGKGVRYEPAAVVRHDHRTRPRAWLARKAFYGTSAAPLAARHPGAVAPVVITPWTVVWSVALLAQRRWSAPVAVLALAGTTASLARRLEDSERPARAAAVLALEGAVASTWQVGAGLTRHYWPLGLVWALRSGRGRRAVLVAAAAEGLADRRRVRSGLGVVPYVLVHRLDDLAYGSGVWWGALRARSPRALLPVLRRGRRRTAGSAV